MFTGVRVPERKLESDNEIKEDIFNIFYKEDPAKALKVPIFELLGKTLPTEINWYKDGKVTKP